MKLKFKAEAKDVAIFILEGRFSGLNPLPAFTKEYIAPTMVFYLIAVIAAFASVQSYFFEREKGIGVSIGGKTEKGYSRLAKDK